MADEKIHNLKIWFKNFGIEFSKFLGNGLYCYVNNVYKREICYILKYLSKFKLSLAIVFDISMSEPCQILPGTCKDSLFIPEET